MSIRWTITEEMNRVHLTQVFAGGACNILDEQGKLLRNSERDRINDWITNKRIIFFDPQIHPDTHGYEYDYLKHHPLEIAARNAAKVNLYEISPRSFCGITALEIATDHFLNREPTVIYYSDGNPEKDALPVHNLWGHPLFEPLGIRDNQTAMQAHYREFMKNGTNMRLHLIHQARKLDTLTVTFNGEIRKNDVVITPYRMHAVDMFTALSRAAGGERIFVYFSGGPETRDAKGNPRFILPENPAEVELNALLDQYVDEGNELRRAIIDLVEISVFLRIVYTQAAAIQALDELFKVAGIAPTAETQP